LAKACSLFCYDEAMRNRLSLFVFFCTFFSLSQASFGQGATGTLDVTARIAPTGARPEPVRQFTFYVLTKSYAEIVKEAAAQFPLEEREVFISNLKISPELKAWMKHHSIIDLTAPDVDKLITPDDVMNIPEFFAGYERSNSGGVTNGLPMPKYKEADAEANPAKYFKLKQEYMSATKKFVESHPSTISGMETELGGVNTNGTKRCRSTFRKWRNLRPNSHRPNILPRRVTPIWTATWLSKDYHREIIG
jgi:hypothetical protein